MVSLISLKRPDTQALTWDQQREKEKSIWLESLPHLRLQMVDGCLPLNSLNFHRKLKNEQAP